MYDASEREGIRVERVATPDRDTLPRGHVIVRVHACGVNPVDAKYCWGDKLPAFLPERAKRKLVDGSGAGFDFAGVVEHVCPSVSRLTRGDRVYGTTPPFVASFAEVVVAPAHQVARIPNEMSFKEAASLPLVGLTILQSLRHKFGLCRGQSILIIGTSLFLIFS